MSDRFFSTKSIVELTALYNKIMQATDGKQIKKFRNKAAAIEALSQYSDSQISAHIAEFERRFTAPSTARDPKARRHQVSTHRAEWLAQTITLLVDENPKKPGSKAAARWELYLEGMTVKEALAAGITRSDLRFNADNEFIALSKGGAVQNPKDNGPEADEE